MKYLVLLIISIPFIACEPYQDISINEMRNTNVISSSNWTVTNATYYTNFDHVDRSYSSSLDHGPGEVAVNFDVEAKVDGSISWHTQQSLESSYISHFFTIEDPIFFSSTEHLLNWSYKEILSKNTIEHYQAGVLTVGPTRIRTRVYDDEPEKVFCYMEENLRFEGRTYRYRIEFWLEKTN
ncbi:hypothetical protein [Flammeovirga sp. SubArs3]|uniref:hypothetical protein n=1 Tax=Flammeovirga sp. SubArs3 TaxID=2995316 RepID=UPI00248D34F9|nr:hypothetical protein [Flammeovirga sp. SubArs3]